MATFIKRGKKWFYIITYYDKDGKRHRHEEPGGATKEEAQKAFRAHIRQADATGEYIKPENITVADFLAEWLEKRVKENNKPATYNLYSQLVENHINDAFGSRLLRSIRTRELQDWLLDLKREGAAQSTVKVVLSILRGSFKWAVANREYIIINPAVNLTMPRYDKAPQAPAVFTQEELDSIFAFYSEGKKLFIPIRIAYYTGMRIGEVLALKWSDIDLFGRFISVSKTLYNGQHNAPKTKGSYRQVSFGQKLMTDLIKQKHWQEANAEAWGSYYTPSPYVCTREDGSQLTANDIRAFEKYCKAHFGGHSFHTFRHTHATRLLASGQFTLEYVAKRLGHSSLATTANIYYNVTKDEARQAADKMEDIL